MRQTSLVSVFFGLVLGGLEFFFLISGIIPSADAAKLPPLVIVIDPGHGGVDSGSIGTLDVSKKKQRLIYEKELTLDLAKRVSKQLTFSQERHKLRRPLQIHLTRERDEFVSLDKRGEIARKLKPDLFLSLHFNSEPTGKVRGFETYVLDSLSPKTYSHQEALIGREQEGANPSLKLLLRTVAADSAVAPAKIAASTIGSSVRRQLVRDRIEIPLRGVRSGVLQLLLSSGAPAVLIEAAYLSEPQDLKYAQSPQARDSLARGITHGVITFLANSSR